MKKYSFLIVFLVLFSSALLAQVGINTDGSQPDPSAMLDVKSASRGFLPPRMTTGQMNSVIAPPAGLLVYNISANSLYWYNGSTWKRFSETITETDPVFIAHPASGITSGNIASWNTAYNSRITAATGTAPLTLSISGNQLSGSIATANSTTNGYLTSADWNTFSNKQNSLVFGDMTSADITITGGSGATVGNGTTLTVNKGNLAEVTSSVLSISGGTGAVLGSGVSVQVKQADATQPGFLSTADWNSFNNKISSQWTANGLKLYYNTGNVGIGTSNPQSKIDIAGNAVIGTTYSGTNAAPANGLLVEGKVGIGTNAPSPSSLVEINSTTSGVLLPRMTYDQRFAIPNPAEGLMVFCTNCGSFGALSIFSSGAWRTFIPCSCAPPAAGVNELSPGQIIWKWNVVAGASGYKWNTSNNYGTATEMATAVTKTETGISCGSAQTRYVWAYSECEISVPVTLTQSVSAAAPGSPTSGAHTATQISIAWNWNSVPDATGYRWGIANDFSAATDMGTAVTRNETSLTCGTAYTRYVWAYNGCGYSSATSLNQSTGSCVVLPTVTSTAVTGIAQKTATGGGNVTWDGGGTIIERGVCWSSSPNPTTSDFKTSDGSGTGLFTSSMTGLAADSLFYVKAYATNGAGTAYGDQLSFTTLPFTIGLAYGGGIVFYIDAAGQHGLIAATVDQGSGNTWAATGYQTTLVPGGTSAAIGTGSTNTDNIVAQSGLTNTYAAGLTRSYTGGGYNDWFLPSKEELNLMYQQKLVIGGIANNWYWSSTEFSADAAWFESLADGGQSIYNKGYYCLVRAVRAF